MLSGSAPPRAGIGLRALVMPLTVGCAMFPQDIVLVFLGSKWLAATSIFRLLAPTMLIFALINPLGWMLMATGRVSRSVKMAFLIAPTVIAGYGIGLRYGPEGVAAGFSIAMLLLAGPLVVWARRGTSISVLDVVKAVSPASLSIAVGAAVVLAVSRYTQSIEPVFLRLVAESALLFGTYWMMLLFALNQKSAYLQIFGELRFRRARTQRISPAQHIHENARDADDSAMLVERAGAQIQAAATDGVHRLLNLGAPLLPAHALRVRAGGQEAYGQMCAAHGLSSPQRNTRQIPMC